MTLEGANVLAVAELMPVCFNEDIRNSLPMENAMKPSATSDTSDRCSTFS